MAINVYDEVKLYRILEVYVGKVIYFTTEVSRAFSGSEMKGLLEKKRKRRIPAQKL